MYIIENNKIFLSKTSVFFGRNHLKLSRNSVEMIKYSENLKIKLK